MGGCKHTNAPCCSFCVKMARRTIEEIFNETSDEEDFNGFNESDIDIRAGSSEEESSSEDEDAAGNGGGAVPAAANINCRIPLLMQFYIVYYY